jgi:hypothetical protein
MEAMKRACEIQEFNTAMPIDKIREFAVKASADISNKRRAAELLDRIAVVIEHMEAYPALEGLARDHLRETALEIWAEAQSTPDDPGGDGVGSPA